MKTLGDYTLHHLNALLMCSKYCEIPEILMDPRLKDEQIHVILDAILEGIDIKIIEKFKSNYKRLPLITEAYKNGHSDKIDILCNPLYDNDQVRALIFGLDNNLDISIYADPAIPSNIMLWVSEKLLTDPENTKKVLDSTTKYIDNVNAAELLMRAEEDDDDLY